MPGRIFSFFRRNSAYQCHDLFIILISGFWRLGALDWIIVDKGRISVIKAQISAITERGLYIGKLVVVRLRKPFFAIRLMPKTCVYF